MTQQTPIRVMTVDDHQIFRSGIKFSLVAFDDIELVGEAHNGEAALELCGQLQPDVILMDMRMGGRTASPQPGLSNMNFLGCRF